MDRPSSPTCTGFVAPFPWTANSWAPRLPAQPLFKVVPSELLPSPTGMATSQKSNEEAHHLVYTSSTVAPWTAISRASSSAVTSVTSSQEQAHETEAARCLMLLTQSPSVRPARTSVIPASAANSISTTGSPASIPLAVYRREPQQPSTSPTKKEAVVHSKERVSLTNGPASGPVISVQPGPTEQDQLSNPSKQQQSVQPTCDAESNGEGSDKDPLEDGKEGQVPAADLSNSADSASGESPSSTDDPLAVFLRIPCDVCQKRFRYLSGGGARGEGISMTLAVFVSVSVSVSVCLCLCFCLCLC